MHNEHDYLEYLLYHSKCSDSLLSKARELSYEDIDLGKSKTALKIRRMMGEVSREIHFMKGFVRLKCPNKYISYGFMKPTHNIGIIISSFLARRFPYTIIILGNNKESWVSIFTETYLYSLSDGPLSHVMDILVNSIDETVSYDNLEKIWKEYYNSQCRIERSSTNRFFRAMPKKHIGAAKLDIEKSGSMTTLDDFILHP